MRYNAKFFVVFRVRQDGLYQKYIVIAVLSHLRQSATKRCPEKQDAEGRLLGIRVPLRLLLLQVWLNTRVH